MPMTTISQTFFQPQIEDLGEAPFIRFWYTQNFIAGDGVTPIIAGNGRDSFYVDVTCSIVSNRLLMPATELWATTTGSPATSLFFGQLYSEEGVPRDMLFGGSPAAAGWQLPTVYGATIAYDELATYNRAAYLLSAPSTWFDANQTILEIRRLAGDFMYAAVGVNGISQSDTAPADAAAPTFISVNSRRASDFQNIIANGASTSNTASQNATAITAAVSAAAAAGRGLYIPVGTFPCNSVTISVPVKFAPGASILQPATGQNITIAKSLIADLSKHFDNALSGQGTISFSGNRSIKDWTPNWWGAVADGVTENRTFIHAMFTAMKTADGGRWLLPANADYLYSPTGTYGNSLDCFSQEASNITIEGSGWSSILTIGGNFGARFGIPYQTQNVLAGTGTGPWTTPPFAEFGAASIGAQSITLSTPAEHSLFAVGNTVYLESGDGAPLTGHPPASFEFNEIKTINTGTGEITLRWGLRSAYDATDADYEPRIVRLNVAPRNITLRNLRIRRSSGAFTVLDFENNRDVTVEYCWIQGLFYSPYCEGVTFRKNLIELTDPTLHTSCIDGGDAQRDQSYVENIIRCQGAYGIIIAGATKDIIVERNTIYGFSQDSSSGIGIWMSAPVRTRPAVGTRVLNNTVILDKTTSSGIVVGNTEGAVIGDNKVRGNVSNIGNAGIQLTDSMTGSRVSDNTVEIGGSDGAALLMVATGASDSITKCAVVNNTLHGPAFGVLMSNSSLGTILKNRFLGNDLAGTVRYRNFSFTDNTIDGIDTNDMRGTFTISDAATTSVVTFTAAWDDANYRVTVTPTTATNTPAAGASRILSIAKTASGFTVTIEAAPGGTRSQAFDWKVER